MAGGYGVPYATNGYHHQQQQQQQFGAHAYGYGNQYQAGAYGQVPYGVGQVGQTVKRRRRHHRHHRHHTADGTNPGSNGDHEQAVPE